MLVLWRGSTFRLGTTRGCRRPGGAWHLRALLSAFSGRALIASQRTCVAQLIPLTQQQRSLISCCGAAAGLVSPERLGRWRREAGAEAAALAAAARSACTIASSIEAQVHTASLRLLVHSRVCEVSHQHVQLSMKCHRTAVGCIRYGERKRFCLLHPQSPSLSLGTPGSFAFQSEHVKHTLGSTQGTEGYGWVGHVSQITSLRIHDVSYVRPAGAGRAVVRCR